MRAVLAPMVADHSFYEAIPGLLRCAAGRSAAPGRRGCAWARATRRSRRSASMLEALALGVATTSGRRSRRPSRIHCADEFHVRLRDAGAGVRRRPMHSHVGESKVQAVVGRKRYGKTLIAHLDGLGLLGAEFHRGARDLARRRRLHASWRITARRGAQPGQQHAARQRPVPAAPGARCSASMSASAPTAPAAPTTRTCTRRCATPRWPRRCRGRIRASGRLGRGDLPRRHRRARPGRSGFGTSARIAPGYKADIVFLDLGTINWIPHNWTVNQLVHTEDGDGGPPRHDRRQLRGPRRQAADDRPGEAGAAGRGGARAARRR